MLTTLSKLREEALFQTGKRLTFQAGHYLDAVRRGCYALNDMIRNMTGIHNLNGAGLVNEAYGKDRPFWFVVSEGRADKNLNNGYTDMLRGAMSAIRNPHFHVTKELAEMDGSLLLVLSGTIWTLTETTTNRQQRA